MSKICILGGGLVGRFVACELLRRNHEILLIDAEKIENLPNGIAVLKSHIDPDSIRELISGYKIIVNCLPGRIGHAIREPLLSIEGLSIADLAFTAEDPRLIYKLAKKNRCRLIYDVGIAPGLSNALLKSAQNKLGVLDSAKIWVGGNPQKQDEEWSYMAPFSPSDVIEEYTRPARIRRNGKNVTEPALSNLHVITVPGYGLMEAFLTDGVRSLLDTIDSKELLEYTVRWPGHIEKYISGDYSEEELIKAWKFDPKRPEFTWLAVTATKGDEIQSWNVIDEGLEGWSSMARTTGLVTVEVAEILAEGLVKEFGVFPPEYLGDDELLLDRIVNKMQDLGVRITLDSN